ncbi:MAG: right-handed parallel beta-helix repeat-containing protein [Labilithrix sp.]|nr:right-handed parallel beta-helix repeat-containing protein [Labilithrix sp.]
MLGAARMAHTARKRKIDRKGLLSDIGSCSMSFMARSARAQRLAAVLGRSVSSMVCLVLVAAGGCRGGAGMTDGAPDVDAGGLIGDDDEGREGACPEGCRIAGSCIDANTVNPEKPCQVCFPSLSGTAWTTMDDGVKCDDGQFCNGADTCLGGECRSHAGAPCPGNTECSEKRKACVCGPGWAGLSCSRCLIYVRPSGDDTRSGGTWTDAVATVGAALEKAAPNGCEIWVAAGTYYPPVAPGPLSSREATLALREGVALYGGFTGQEAMRSERDFKRHVTVLSGDIGVPNVASDNSYYVVSGVDGATLDGFTVTAGSIGGMYNWNSSPIVSNCVFSRNSGYAGMHNRSSPPTVASPTVANCTFVANSGYGGMFNDGSSPTVTNCIFAGNSATTTGGGIYNSSRSSPNVTNCVFFGNTAGSAGGGVFNEASSSPNIVNSIFFGNAAASGAAIYNQSSSSAIVSHTNIQGGCPPDVTCSNIITADPRFVDPANGDFRLKPDSPCIHAGNTAALPRDAADLNGNGNTFETLPFDFDNKPRVQGPSVDMGAFER